MLSAGYIDFEVHYGKKQKKMEFQCLTGANYKKVK
jgi:hypothetical protein